MSGPLDEGELAEPPPPPVTSMEEDEEPRPGLAKIGIDENVEMGGRNPLRLVATHQDVTRRRIAYALVAVLVLLVAVGCLGWLLYGDDLERIQAFSVLFAPIVTLVGTVLGFYFSHHKDH